jgi:S1-C subfamily serine protease
MRQRAAIHRDGVKGSEMRRPHSHVALVTITLCSIAVLAFAACSSDSGGSLPRSTVPPVTATTAPCDEDHAIARVRSSTVRVFTDTTSGTGIIVDLGVVLTLDHVVAHAGPITISTANGPYPASVRSEDPANDLALLTVPQLTSPAVKWGDTGGLVAGQRLVAFTYPDGATGGSPASTSGSFTGIVTINGAEYVRTDTSPDSDSTGGPLFTLCGEIVGMNTLSARSTPVIAIPSSVLRRFSGAGEPAGSGSGTGGAPTSSSGAGAVPTGSSGDATRTVPPPSGAQ